MVYIWNATDNTVEQLAETSAEDIYVSSVAWAGNGKYLAIGSSDAEIAVSALMMCSVHYSTRVFSVCVV